ncbi:MAG: hypothetical protein Q8N51_05855 [Gammaproteobacteria bacterium]|nr:hypothetical protein [Gammaproteobacteria bacterium]
MAGPADLIVAAQGYAQRVVADAQRAMSSASSSVGAMTLRLNPITPATLPSAPPSTISVVPPVFAPSAFTLPSEPSAAPIYQNISPLEHVAFPSFSGVNPTLNMPNRPTSLPSFSGSPPGITTSLAFPAMPTVLSNPLPPEPILPTRGEPTAPTIMLPSFDAVAPLNDAVAPTDHQSRFESSYAGMAPSMVATANGYMNALMAQYCPRYTEQMAAIEGQLATYLAGGTGLNAAAENAIYERSRSKQDGEARRLQDAAWSSAADRGFTLPNGALASGLRSARQAAADNNAASAREIVVMQAEIEQKNLQFAVTTSTGLRTTMLNATLAYMQNLTTINAQALDYAKSVLGAIIEIYNTQVKAFGVKLEAYKAEAAVYEVKIKGAMAGIELYKAEIDALQAMTQVDLAQIGVYKARIESLGAYASIWKTQIEAVLGRVSLEKLRVDAFQAQVQAYSAMVQGKNAEWQGYESAINGETAKSKMFATQVDAYSAQVNGAKARVEGLSEVVRAAAITNQARAAQYEATLRGYTAVVNARADVAKVGVDIDRQKLIAFQAGTQYEIAKAQLLSDWYKVTSNVAIENNRMLVDASRVDVDLFKTTSATVASLANANAQTFASLAGSAMSGMNSLAAQTEAL